MKATAWRRPRRDPPLLLLGDEVGVTEIPYVPLPAELPARYAHGPDSFPQPGVPRGALHQYEWNESRVLPGTHRRYWVYVPARYTKTEPAALMVFQDAEWYLDPDLQARAPTVFDNLIHRGEIPVTICVFVAPGEPGRRNLEYARSATCTRLFS